MKIQKSCDDSPLWKRRFKKNSFFFIFPLDSGGALCYLADPLRRERGRSSIRTPLRDQHRAPRAPLFENGTAFSGHRPTGRAATDGGAREAGPDSKVSLC